VVILYFGDFDSWPPHRMQSAEVQTEKPGEMGAASSFSSKIVFILSV